MFVSGRPGRRVDLEFYVPEEDRRGNRGTKAPDIAKVLVYLAWLITISGQRLRTGQHGTDRSMVGYQGIGEGALLPLAIRVVIMVGADGDCKPAPFFSALLLDRKLQHGHFAHLGWSCISELIERNQPKPSRFRLFYTFMSGKAE
jgi:hypothetical protein